MLLPMGSLLHTRPTLFLPTNDIRILIVDDDRDIAKFFKLALDHAGFITDVYSDPLSVLMNLKGYMICYYWILICR